MKPLYLAGVAMLTTAGLIAACAPEARTATAAQDYADYCAACHGATGKGDGPAAAGRVPGRADLTRIAARHGGQFPELQVMGRINGYTMGRSDTTMPSFADLLDGPSVMYGADGGTPEPTSQRLVALMQYLKAMQD
ncbi:MAG: c-type cytochrome [Paracoccus sp. (in: a-proteobacteria)]|nr:c-type cytochrome [Paracoccus sp. (in: a-proteobacteria)]